MRICDIKIENFRGIKTGYVQFSKNAIIIGPNNCGKTTLIEALALLFGRDRMVKVLTEHDFYGSDPLPINRINILATVTDFKSDDPSDFTDWFGDNRGVPKWYDAATKKVYPTKAFPSCKLACQIAFSARFDRSILEVETIRYFYDGNGAFEDVFANDAFTALPKRITTELGFFLVPANRSWDKIISFTSELFKRLIIAGGGPPAEAVLKARDSLRNPTEPLENDANLSKIVDDINNELAGFFSNSPKLKLRLTSTDSEGVLESVIAHFSQHGISQNIPSRRHGNGLISLQWLLLLLQFGKLRATTGENFIMALEEPELHIPPYLQQKLIHRLQALSSQTIITTHSPTVASISDPTNLIVLYKQEGELSGKNLLSDPLSSSTPASIRKLFQLNRTDTVSALMHELVLIPEGRIDFDILRLLTRAVDLRQGWVSSDANDFGTAIGLIPTHDASMKETYKVLSSLHTHVCCLVDGDKAGQEYSDEIVKISGPKTIIIKWSDDWTIEDIIGWILESNDKAALEVINKTIEPNVKTTKDLVERLKTTDRKIGGLKQDHVAYENIIDAIYEVKECNARAQSLLVGIAKALINQPTRHFKQLPSPNEKIYVFQT